MNKDHAMNMAMFESWIGGEDLTREEVLWLEAAAAASPLAVVTRCVPKLCRALLAAWDERDEARVEAKRWVGHHADVARKKRKQEETKNPFKRQRDLAEALREALLPGTRNGKVMFTCPVCIGRGFVGVGFYLAMTPVGSSAGTAPEPCRTCGGTGAVWASKAQALLEGKQPT